MRSTHLALSLGVAAVLLLAAACAPLPVDIPIAASPRYRPKIVALALDGVLQQVAVLDLTDVDERLLPTLPVVDNGQAVDVVVVTLDDTLDSFGLAAGLFEVSSTADFHPTVAQHATRAASVEGATVRDGVLSSFEVVQLPGWLAPFRIPTLQGCTTIQARPLADLSSVATFVVRLSDGRALVGTRANAETGALFIYSPDTLDPPITVRLEQPPEVSPSHFYAMGALPLSDRPNEVWLAMRFGEMWRVSLSPDRVEAPSVRVPSGLEMGFAFIHGRATADGVDLYGLSPDGPLVRFDGTRVDTLYTFPAGSYFGGGIAADSDGVVFAGRSSQVDIVEVVDGRARPVPIDGGREGVTAVALVPDVGLIASDGRGRVYRRDRDTFTPLTELDFGTGAQAIVSTGSGFIGAGGAGVTREWRLHGGLCPQPASQVSQTLRWWAPFGTGWLVSGPERDGATQLQTPLTYFTTSP